MILGERLANLLQRLGLELAVPALASALRHRIILTGRAHGEVDDAIQTGDAINARVL